MNTNDAIARLEAIAKLPENWKRESMNQGPIPLTVWGAATQLEAAIGSLPVEPVSEVPADPHEGLKQAWDEGRQVRVKSSNGTWGPWRNSSTSELQWIYPPDCYEIEPIPAATYHTPAVVEQRREEAAAINAVMNPAGKTDKELGSIGAKAAFETGKKHGNRSAWLIAVHDGKPGSDIGYSAWRNDEPARTAFACAVREAVEKGTPWGAVGQTQEEWLHSTSELGRMAHERFVAEIARLTAEVALYSGNCRAMDIIIGGQRAELAKANAELERLRWRPVSVNPTESDAAPCGLLHVITNDGTVHSITIDAWILMSGQLKWWRPFCPPPAPTAEEEERGEFEAWWDDCDLQHLINKEGAFKIWHDSRASKEGK